MSYEVDEILELSKGCCSSCPFNEGMTEEADFAQNMGCLPWRGDIIEALSKGKVWECHSKPGKVCRGAVNAAAKRGIEISDTPNCGETFGDLYEPS